MIPDGQLTRGQYEILDIVWESGESGASVSEVWQAIAAARDVGRTTILNLVDRLEKRGWLRRLDGDGVNRFIASVTREQATSALATEFVDDFFSGSPSELVLSLLGSDKLDASEVRRLRELLDSVTTERARRRKGGTT